MRFGGEKKEGFFDTALRQQQVGVNGNGGLGQSPEDEVSPHAARAET